MEPSANAPSSRPRLHPLVATAAISIIVLAAVGVTVLVMNHSGATSSPYDAPVATTAPAAQAVAAPPPIVAPVVPAPPVVAAPRVVASTPAKPTYNGGSAPVQPAYDNPPPVARAEVCRDCGVVDSLREIKVKGQGSGVGAVGGAVVGGLLGNLVGAGRGKALATVAGAVGGGFGGNAIEKNVRSEIEHQMIVRLDGGGTRTFTQAAPFAYREGEHVRIVNGHVERD